MYTPGFNRMIDKQDAVDFMQKYSFATIVTVVDGIPTATHLPFIVEQRGDTVVLVSHFAKANHQSEDIFGCTALVIFTEPHAYISPAHYEKELNVPTWNYLAVHAYGKATLIDQKTQVAQILENTISFYEVAYLKQWNNLPDEYKSKMMNGIVAFEIVVDDLQGKSKLSQNRTEQERNHIISAFAKSEDQNEQKIADYMARLK